MKIPMVLILLLVSFHCAGFELSTACGDPKLSLDDLKSFKVIKSFGELTANSSGDFGGAKLHLIKNKDKCQFKLEWAEGFPVTYLSQIMDCKKSSNIPTKLEVFEIQGQWAADSKKGEMINIVKSKGGLEITMSGVKMTAKTVKPLSQRDQFEEVRSISEANHLRSCVRSYKVNYPKDPYLEYVIANSQNAINERDKLPICKANGIKDFKTNKDKVRNTIIEAAFLGTFNSQQGMQCFIDSFLKISKKERTIFLNFLNNYYSNKDYYDTTSVSNFLWTLKKTTQGKKCIGNVKSKSCTFAKTLLEPAANFLESAKTEAKKRKDNNSLKSINETKKELKEFLR